MNAAPANTTSASSGFSQASLSPVVDVIGSGNEAEGSQHELASAVAGLRAMLAVVHDRAHAGGGPRARRFLLVLAAEAQDRQARELLELRARRYVRGPRHVDREVFPMKLEARIVAQADEAERSHARAQVARPAIHDERCGVGAAR